MAPTDQDGFAFRFDWGVEGLRALAPSSAVVVIVDVLRFTTTVTVAVGRGAEVLPHPWKHDELDAYAAARGAVAAHGRESAVTPERPWSLSPKRMSAIPAGTRVVLPSPNGSALAFAAHDAGASVVLAGCLRNASAVASAAFEIAGHRGAIAVIAAGERWPGRDTLRPAVEDLVGAAAILAALDPAGSVSAPSCSPEAMAARAAFSPARPRLREVLATCSSGRELAESGLHDDVDMAAAWNTDTAVPVLRGDAFVSLRE
ncbi:MAG TPA: 2-phosphosulfolactate phosphatase [Acidimicrobiales bacterium]